MDVNAEQIVDKLLEDGEQQDAHMEPYRRVQKWDKAHSTYGHLYGLKLKAMDLFRQMGRSIGYERALAHVGVDKADVERQIYGDQIGATHNFKGTRTLNVCNDNYCDLRGKPQKGDKCSECGSVLTPKAMRYAPNDLRYKFPRHMFGVQTKDGRIVWFPAPLPPQPEATEQPPEEAAQ